MLIKDIKTEVRILARCERCNDILKSSQRDEQNEARFVLYLEPCEKCMKAWKAKGGDDTIDSIRRFVAKDTERKAKDAKKKAELAKVEEDGPDIS